jgi:hypothetical protein
VRLRLGAVLLAGVLLVACEPQLPDAESPGAQLYAARCGGCHRLYAPGLMTAEMWKITVTRMQGELVRRGVAPLNSVEQATLLAYLEQHSTGRAQ